MEHFKGQYHLKDLELNRRAVSKCVLAMWVCGNVNWIELFHGMS